MGKGYNNYMCKKPFHPGSKANIKRAWMAEQKTENDKRKQEELKVQYEKEQNLYTNKALISSESKDKLELNFMYEAPPGAKRERQKEDDEPEYKFEWQRKYNAPREDYAKGNEDIKDQPFGIPVRNVRCIKCHKWGHINTDKECPLYHQASTSAMPTTSMDPMELMKQMKEDGYGLKEHVLGHQLNPAAANQQFIPSDESDPEMEFLKSLTTAEKKKLLRKLKKLSKKQEKKSNCKKKKSKKAKKSNSKDSSSDSEEEEEEVTKKKKKKKHKRKTSSSESDSSSSDDNAKRKKKKKKEAKSSKESKSKTKKKSAKDTEAKHSYSSDSNSSGVKNESKEKFVEKPSKESQKKIEIKSEKDSSKVDVVIKTEKASVSPVKSESSDNKLSKSNTKVVVKEEKSNGSEEIKHKMQKLETTNSKQVKSDILESECDGKRKISNSESEDGLEVKKIKFIHPDGFSHLCPQTRIKENYILPEVEYKGEVHDKFRHRNRDKRSPSVKQKYNC